MKRKKRRWGIWARGAVTAFSVFVALDTFIIPAAYSSVKAGDSTLFSELESRAACSRKHGCNRCRRHECDVG